MLILFTAFVAALILLELCHMVTLADLNAKADQIILLAQASAANQQAPGTQDAIDAASLKLDQVITILTPPVTTS